MQPAGQIIDTNQYYYAAAPPQHMTPQPGVSYQYASGFYAEPYMVAASTPSQSSQPVIMPVGHPGFIYMPPPSNPVYYSVPAAAAAPAATTTTPYFYAPDVYVPQTMPVPQPIATHSVVPAEVPVSRTKSAVRPLSTSTPLPTEFAQIAPPMTNQLPYAGNVAHLKYHRNIEQDDVLANLSKISVVSEETVGGENEKEIEHRPPRQRRPLTVPFNYKTRMCLTYASGKQCEMGSRCKFAHGPEELRVADAPPKAPNARYKTKLCKNFGPFASNYCPYGLRCEFIHPNDKEYALVCPAPPHPSSRNPNHIDNLSQNMCNVTPENMCDAPPICVTRSAVKPAAEKILLKNRNIAGSMMCLASTGKREHPSDDSAIGSGSSESGGSVTHAKVMARARESIQTQTVPIKFLRRRSMSQLTLKRFKSTENLDVAASCSQLANLDLNHAPMSVFSPLK
ncbi:hypothetical protein Q1695_009879 [Nippostrongylus brasiliensis]|nr:hypothetical protein Q1695_009879 [Nippostrongylus brasiliensis]